MIQIGVISDTHDVLREEVLDYLKTCQVILHAGDVTQMEIIEALQAIAPTYVVKGNNDKGAFGEKLPVYLEFELYGYHFCMAHQKKDLPKLLDQMDFIITGHSHKYAMTQEKSTIWLNPGSCGKRRFGLEISMAIIEISEEGAVVHKKQLVPPTSAL